MVWCPRSRRAPALALVACLGVPALAAPEPGKFVLGFVDGSFASGQANANTYAANLTAVTIGSMYWVTNTGTIETASGQPITPATIVSQAHQNGLHAYADISNCDGTGTWNDGFAYGAVVTHASTTIANIVAFVQANGFDGCTLDFEYDSNGYTAADPTPGQFDAFTASLAAQLHAANANYRLIVAIAPHNNWFAAAYDTPGLAGSADYLFLMMYNECGPVWTTPGYNHNVTPGPNAGLDWIQGELSYQTGLGVPAGKLLLGLPCYGMDYDSGDSRSPAYNGGNPFWSNYSTILGLHPGAALHTGLYGDEVTPWAAWGNVAYTDGTGASEPAFWYDDAASIEAKAGLASSNNLGGAGVYAVGYENQSFWTAFGNGLAGSVPLPVTGYTITASAGSGGSISPYGAVSVPAGGSQAFTIRASSGYGISSVTVDGTAMGAIGSYTFSGVTAPHTITAAFQRSRRGRGGR